MDKSSIIRQSKVEFTIPCAKVRYKVGKATFDEMVEKLRPILEPNRTRAVASSGSPVTTELQLSMTLRYMAGASSPVVPSLC